jgi:predicted transcriptional regulator
MAQEPGSTKTRFEEFGRRIDERVGEALPRVEEEVKKVIAYLNDEVVPQVRQNSSQALRIAAEQLQRLAERLDRRQP